LTWPIIQNHVETVYTVTDEEIVKAMKLVYERMKIVIEPSSAVPIAVALWNKEFKELKNIKDIVIIVSGGNVDLEKITFKNE
jgi:threonine dehydratase